MKQTVATHIELRPNRASQMRAFVIGTRVRVQDIYALAEISGLSADEICVALPDLNMGQVHGALSYFFDHREEILQEIREDAAFVAEFRRKIDPSSLAASLEISEQNRGEVSSR